MADRKISAHTALTGANVAAGDLVEVVDISDATDAASGTNKKILLSQFGGKFLIEEKTVSAVASISFASIPQEFNHLIIEGYAQTDAAGSQTDNLHIQFNGDDTETNYYSQFLSSINISVSAGEAATARLINASGATGASPALFEGRIPEYKSSIIKSAFAKSYINRVSGADLQIITFLTYHDTLTAPITSLGFVSATAANITGVFRLYGAF